MSILTAVKPGLSNKDFVEQTKHFIFTGENICTYNDQVLISYPFETDFRCSVLASVFYESVKKMRGELLDMKLDKRKRLTVVNMEQKFTMSTEIEAKAKVEDVIDDLTREAKTKKWEKLPEDFNQALQSALFSASTDLTTGAFTCVLISGDDVLSGDRFRVTWIKLSTPLKGAMLLAGKELRELVKFNVIEYQDAETWVFFRDSKGVFFFVRKPAYSDSDFPPLQDYFTQAEAEETKAQFKIPQELKESLGFVSVIASHVADEKYRASVQLSLRENSLQCSTIGDTMALKPTASDQIAVEYAGPPLDFSINPYLLQEAMAHSSRLMLKDKKVLFTTQGFKHMIALIIPERGENT